MKVPVRIHADLRFPLDGIPRRALEALDNALRVVNPMEPGMTPIVLGRSDSSGHAVLPRGFARKLAKGFAAYGIEPVWHDQRVNVPMEDEISVLDSFTLRPYQIKPYQRMLQVEQGIAEMPTGSGKTCTFTFFAAEARQRTIVLVDKINLADQWQNRIREQTGYVAGIIGDGQWAERDITIATRQSLWSRHDQLAQAGWFDRWGVVCMDECHAVSAPSVRELIQCFPARYRIGLSATPDRHDWLTIVSRSIIGEIFCRTTEEELEEAGVLVRPRVVVTKTVFEFPWKDGADPRRQWHALLRKLRTDKHRNQAIGKILGGLRGHAVLVDTDQVTHAHELRAYALAFGWPDDRVFMFTGAQSAAERQKIVRRADEGDIVIISTIGKEALDIPRLDRFLMTWPTRNSTRVTQMIGRVRRIHENKAEPIIYDFWDRKVGVLADQFHNRRVTYSRANMEMTYV